MATRPAKSMIEMEFGQPKPVPHAVDPDAADPHAAPPVIPTDTSVAGEELPAPGRNRPRRSAGQEV